MSAVTGAGDLLQRLMLRRDRVLLAVWIYFFLVVPVSFAYSFGKLYPTAAARERFTVSSQGNSVFNALYGHLYGSSLGQLVAWRSGFLFVLAGLFAIFAVIRNTRAEEQAGRRELLGSAALGRDAGLAAALAESVIASVAVVILSTAGLIIVKHLPLAGTVTLGVEFAAVSMVFAAVAAVAAQLTNSAAAARGIAIVILAVAYLLRIVGDAGLGAGWSWLSWVTPIGWAEQMRAYGGDRWWLLGPVAALIVVLLAVAVSLSARRDFGAGLLPDRLGPAHASPRLRSPLALAWRLHRGLLAAWTVAFAVVGVLDGALANSMANLLRSSRGVADIFTRLGGGQATLSNAFLAALMGLLAMVASAYAIQASLKLRDEESSGRAEPILATRTSRLQWVGSHLVLSVLGPALAIVVAGLMTGLVYGLNIGSVGPQVAHLLGAALVQLPAIWVLTAISLTLFGLLPQYMATASWAVLGICMLIELVGQSAQLSQWLLDISPFVHVPRVPGGAVSATPLIWLAAIAVALAVAGLAGVRRRDLPVS